MAKSFVLDSVLAADSTLIEKLDLCQLRLMHDSNFPWLLLVPERPGVSEMIDLEPADRAVLIEEIARAGRLLRSAVRCDKLNIAALGNAVRQLHIHVIARTADDAAWPRTIWWAKPHVAYQPAAFEALMAELRAALPNV